VDQAWVADGFNLTDDCALAMLAHRLQHACVGTELKAQVTKTPDPQEIADLQGFAYEG
jgi:hypothetical protein